jgi:dipeptidyl aminopeptidase/acylaminoacyl peptidase
MKSMIRLLAVAATLGLAGTAARSAERTGPAYTAEDWLGIQTLAGGQPAALSPDGRWITYVLTDLADGWNVLEFRPTGHVFVQGTDSGARARALTEGAVHSSHPSWSPDGRKLAFFREDQAGGRLGIWEADSGRVRLVGQPYSGRSRLAPQWDPSGRSVVYARPVKDPEPGETPRVTVVKSTDARIPGDDFFVDAGRSGLAALDLATGKETSLLPSPVVLRSFALSPVGGQLVYSVPTPETLGVIGKEKNATFLVSTAGGAASRVSPEDGVALSWSPGGRRLVYSRDGKLMAIPVGPEGAGAPVELIPGLEIKVRSPLWSPDGERFVALVPDESVRDPELEPAQPGMYSVARPFMDLYLVSRDGSARNLTSGFEDQVSDPVWSPDGDSVVFTATDNVTYDETLYRHTLADGKLAPLTAGEESYDDLSAAPGLVSMTVQDAGHPEDLWLVEGSGTRRRITDLNPQLARFRFSRPELFYYYSADGERLGALLYKPVGYQPGDRFPVITNVYEKMTPQVHRFDARHQIYLNHGFGVLMPNVKVKVGATATSFVKCAVPAVNAVRAMGVTNGRFGIWGGSFGAYATSYLITQTDIFSAAVSRATPPELFRNWASGRDRDSRNIERGQARMGGSPFEYPERYLSQSAFFQLDKVSTPVLIMHGVQDLTILFGEGEMMFYALRQLGKEATFVAYAHGDHSLSRHSRADTLDVDRRVLEWFDHYLKGPAE